MAGRNTNTRILPPLPRVGPADGAYRPAGTSALDLLDEQHAQLSALAARLDDGTPGRESVTSVLVATASRVLCAQEQYLFPVVRAVLPGGPDLADRELAAARSLRETLERLGTWPAAAARSAVRDATGQLAGHIDRCGQLAQRLRGALDEEALIRLGNRVEIALEAAPSRPHPGLPQRPPLNKWIAPVVGAVDKVRDALTRRVTYPEDL